MTKILLHIFAMGTTYRRAIPSTPRIAECHGGTVALRRTAVALLELLELKKNLRFSLVL